MPGLLLHTGALIQCPHLAPAAIAPAQTQVLVSGQPVAIATAKITVTGCPNPPPPATPPSPCVTVTWQLTSTRVKVAGQPVLLQPVPGTGPGVCQNPLPLQVPQGPPMVNQIQRLVTGT
jgi:hypothetical protein